MTYRELQRERLKNLLEAEQKILINQSYSIGDREYVRPDLEKVQKKISDLMALGVTLEDEKAIGNQKRVVFVD